MVVGLLTCESVASYKRMSIVPIEKRKALSLVLKGVHKVVSQYTLDYEHNLRRYKPVFCVHGSE